MYYTIFFTFFILLPYILCMKFVNFFRSKIYKIANKERNDPIFMRLILIFFYFIRIKNIISFFLCRILTAPVGRVWRFTHFYSVAPLLEKWFTCHHSTPYFFIIIFPTAFYRRSRMTGRYLLPFCKKLFLRICSYLPLPSTCQLTP